MSPRSFSQQARPPPQEGAIKVSEAPERDGSRSHSIRKEQQNHSQSILLRRSERLPQKSIPWGYVLSKKLLTIVFLFIFGGLANAAPVTIDFTSLATGTAVTNQYPGVTFSLLGGTAGGPPVTGNQFGATGLSNSISGNYPTAYELVATFNSPVSGISFLFNPYGSDIANLYVLRDASNNVITSGSLTLNGGAQALYDLSSFSGVSSISWGNNNRETWIHSLDSLSFNTASSVPEIDATTATVPVALTLLLLLVLSDRRREFHPTYSKN